MPAIQVDIQLSANKILEAIEKMSSTELEQLFSRVIALRAQRKAPHLSAQESELLIKINEGLPPDIQARLNELTTKRRENTLTPDEHKELLGLIDKLEEAEAARADALAQLARLRGVSMTALMDDLGIQAPDYV